MLELIFQGFAEWAYGIILEIWTYFSSSLLEIMSLDFAYLKVHIPVLGDIMQVLMAVGWALLLGNLVFQAVRSMAAGLGFEGEDPRLLFARTAAFSFLLLASPQICEIGLNLTSNIIALLEIPNVIDVTLLNEDAFAGLGPAWLLVILCGVVVMFKVLKLLLAIAERYLILAVLVLTAPLAFAMGGSKSTAPIFSGWCRMFGSMCLLMVTNVVFFKMLFSVLSTLPVGLDVFPWMVLVLAITRVAQKADGIITRIGLNPAPGGSSGRGLAGVLAFTVARTAASQVVKNVGGGRGKSSGKPPNGAPKGPAGGPKGAGRGTSAGTGSAHTQRETSQNTAQKTESYQTNNSQSNGGQNTAKNSAHTASQQADSQRMTAQERSTVQTARDNRPEKSQRSTSVPSGARRGPNHVGSCGSAKAPRPGPAGTGPGSAVFHSAQTTAQTVRGGPVSSDARSTEQSSVSMNQGRTAGSIPGGKTPQGKSGGSSVQSTPANQKPQAGTRIETRSTRRERNNAPPGSAGKVPSSVSASSTERRTSRTTQQETGRTSVFAKSPVNGGGPTVHPGPAGTPPSPAAPSTERRGSGTVRQETRSTLVSAKPPMNGGGPTVHLGSAGTPPSPTAPPTERHTSSTVRQETWSTSVPTKPPSNGSIFVPRPGPAGTAPPSAAVPPTERRTTGTLRHEARSTSVSAKPPVKGNGPMIRSGSAGSAADGRPKPGKNRIQPSRTTRADQTPRPPMKGGKNRGRS